MNEFIEFKGEKVITLKGYLGDCGCNETLFEFATSLKKDSIGYLKNDTPIFKVNDLDVVRSWLIEEVQKLQWADIDSENAKAEAETNAEQEDFVGEVKQKRKGTPRKGRLPKGMAERLVRAVCANGMPLEQMKTCTRRDIQKAIEHFYGGDLRSGGKPLPGLSTIGDTIMYKGLRKWQKEQK